MFSNSISNRIFSTFIQGNKIMYNFNDKNYFGIHYAFYSAFKVTNIITNNTYIVNEGEFFLSKNASNYTIESIDNKFSSIITLLVEPSYLNSVKGNELLSKSVLDFFIESPSIPFIITDLTNAPKHEKADLEEIFKLFTANNTAPALTNQIFLESLVKKILIYIDTNCIANKLNESYLLTSIKKYIVDNMSTANLTNAAAYLNYDSSYISNCVKKETGLKFSELLLNMRMNKAIELLNKNDDSLSEISKMTGYAKTSSFIRVFKNKYKVTPGEYKSNPTILN